jgi:hypothetical protein
VLFYLLLHVLQQDYYFVISLKKERSFFSRVGTYVQRGSKLCFVVVVVLLFLVGTLTVGIPEINFRKVSKKTSGNAELPFFCITG